MNSNELTESINQRIIHLKDRINLTPKNGGVDSLRIFLAGINIQIVSFLKLLDEL